MRHFLPHSVHSISRKWRLSGHTKVTHWQDGVFKNNAELKVTDVDGPHINVSGNVAWLAGITHAQGKLKNGNSVDGNVVATQVFEKQGGS
jgi:ketosteroid isomerase-like protein